MFFFLTKNSSAFRVFFPLEPVAFAMHNMMHNGIHNKQALHHSEDWRVQVIALALGPEFGNKRQSNNNKIQNIHDNEMSARFVAKILFFRSVQLEYQKHEAHQVDVAWTKNHNEEPKNVLGAKLEEKKTYHDADV